MKRLELGDIAKRRDVIRVYSRGVAEDGRTRYVMYDLRGGMVGYQSSDLHITWQKLMRMPIGVVG